MSSEPNPNVSKPAAGAAAIPAMPLSTAKSGSLAGRTARHVFSPDTRAGRILRPLVRGLAVTVGFFALGLLACYLLLYQPAERRLLAAEARLGQANQDLQDRQEALRKAALSLAGAETDRQSVSGALEKLQARLALQQAQTGVAQARLGLALKDSAAASLALNGVETRLKEQMAVLTALAGADADKIGLVIGLARSDLNGDANLAQQDLQRLASELDLLDQALR